MKREAGSRGQDSWFRSLVAFVSGWSKAWAATLINRRHAAGRNWLEIPSWTTFQRKLLARGDLRFSNAQIHLPIVKHMAGNIRRQHKRFTGSHLNRFGVSAHEIAMGIADLDAHIPFARSAVQYA